MASSSITEEARHRKNCLNQWNNDLDNLVAASNTYMTSTARLVKTCPLNDTAPLQSLGVADDGTVASVTDVFDRIRDRVFEIGLVEEQVRLSKSSLVRRRNRMADVTSVSRLPDEVLALVFEFIARTKDTTAPMHVTGVRRVAMLRPEIIFTWVSQQWRDIALNLPRLWCDITFFKENPPFIRTQKYLIRSQEIPLRLTFSIFHIPLNQHLNPDVYLITAIGTVLPAFNRWERISIVADNVKQVRRCFYAMGHSGKGNNAKQIKSIRIAVGTAPGVPVKVLFNDDLSRFWRGAFDGLHGLSLTGVAIPWDWTGWYSKLRHLKLAYTDASSELLTVPFAEAVWPLKSQFLTVLQACPNLETLDLVEIRFRDDLQFLDSTPPLGPITSVLEEHEEHGVSLPHLHKLSIKSRHCPTIRHLLDMTVVNNLEDFHCDTRGGADARELDYLSTLFMRLSHAQAAPLRRFSLAHDYHPSYIQTGAKLLDLLQRVPRLEELITEEAEFSDEFLKALTPPSAFETRPVILPKLRILKLRKIPDPVTPASVINLVRGRAEAAASASTSDDQGPNSYVPLRIVHVRRPKTDLSPHRVLPVGEYPIDIATAHETMKQLKALTEILDEFGWNDSTWTKGTSFFPEIAPTANGTGNRLISGPGFSVGDLLGASALFGGAGLGPHAGFASAVGDINA